tara:strand:+ start:128 stop:541 length:414 start_codon:yes stop_codon:yes gene_type:complete
MADNKIKIEKRKVFEFRGKPLDELQAMDIREFSKLIPARERRTVLRNTDVIEKFISRSKKKISNKKQVKTHDRSLVIVPAMVGMTVGVHNGRAFERVEITTEMLGHRLGEFALTRGLVKHGTAGIGATRSSASRSVK